MSCQKVQPLLSGYIDNALSARSTWEVDGHLARCNSCSRLLGEMRRTVHLLSASDRFEVPADFATNLQSRLAGLEPAASRFAWMDGLRMMFRPRVLPAWGAAAGACALGVITLLSRAPVTAPGSNGRIPASLAVERAASTNVALSANDPLADVAAANLTAIAAADAGSGASAR